ncbi:hypothetical protein CYFUS_004467 [Cystobacter fuscus]|uniref:Uncharacterized protein n=1 Tax=Cystobacter fuscus TaxID=43 RepID=A0A250J667_9BACT|nr:hypothetical protein [Cystobacter fuscus]ATB39028.1 hypothetical protein CYFUS_004467 [Cystobacter fuscus]
MLSIDTLHLRLPAGFEHRASSIVHLLGRELSRAPVQAELSLPLARLSLQLDPGLSDGEIARRIATALLATVEGTR